MSVHEATWDEKKKVHTCCGSKHSYHLTSCKVRNAKPTMTALDEELKIRIRDMKVDGMTSGDIFTVLKYEYPGLTLKKVNDLFV